MYLFVPSVIWKLWLNCRLFPSTRVSWFDLPVVGVSILPGFLQICSATFWMRFVLPKVFSCSLWSARNYSFSFEWWIVVVHFSPSLSSLIIFFCWRIFMQSNFKAPIPMCRINNGVFLLQRTRLVVIHLTVLKDISTCLGWMALTIGHIYLWRQCGPHDDIFSKHR